MLDGFALNLIINKLLSAIGLISNLSSVSLKSNPFENPDGMVIFEGSSKAFSEETEKRNLSVKSSDCTNYVKIIMTGNILNNSDIKID